MDTTGDVRDFFTVIERFRAWREATDAMFSAKPNIRGKFVEDSSCPHELMKPFSQEFPTFLVCVACGWIEGIQLEEDGRP